MDNKVTNQRAAQLDIHQITKKKKKNLISINNTSKQPMNSRRANTINGDWEIVEGEKQNVNGN